MPLAGTQKQLAKKIAQVAASTNENIKYSEEVWEKIAKEIIDQFTTNAVITGTADGKDLVDGKIT